MAVVKGPQDQTHFGPCVYLEVYYKHGEWSVTQGTSRYIKEAMNELEDEMEKDGMLEEWDKMSQQKVEHLALERCQQNVDDQKGWGAVMRVPGILVAQATM